MRTTRYEYHSHPFRSFWKPPEIGDVGVEIELFAEANTEFLNALNEDITSEAQAMAAERDGSIDRYYGVEIISPPLPLEQAISKEGYFAKLMERIGGLYTVPNTNYGMHISFNTVDWPLQVLDDVILFIRSAAPLGVRIGRRPPGYNQYWAAAWRQGQRITNGGQRNRSTVVTTYNNGRMEVRLFLAPENFDQIRVGMQYVLAVKEYVTQNPQWSWEGVRGVSDQDSNQYGPGYMDAGVIERRFLSWLTSSSCTTEVDTLLEYLSLNKTDTAFDTDELLRAAATNYRRLSPNGSTDREPAFVRSLEAGGSLAVEESPAGESERGIPIPPTPSELGMLNGSGYCVVCNAYHLTQDDRASSEFSSVSPPSIEQAARLGHPAAIEYLSATGQPVPFRARGIF